MTGFKDYAADTFLACQNCITIDLDSRVSESECESFINPETVKLIIVIQFELLTSDNARSIMGIALLITHKSNPRRVDQRSVFHHEHRSLNGNALIELVAFQTVVVC